MSDAATSLRVQLCELCCHDQMPSGVPRRTFCADRRWQQKHPYALTSEPQHNSYTREMTVKDRPRRAAIGHRTLRAVLDSVMHPAVLRIDCGGSIPHLEQITQACWNRRVRHVLLLVQGVGSRCL